MGKINMNKGTKVARIFVDPNSDYTVVDSWELSPGKPKVYLLLSERGDVCVESEQHIFELILK